MKFAYITLVGTCSYHCHYSRHHIIVIVVITVILQLNMQHVINKHTAYKKIE